MMRGYIQLFLKTTSVHGLSESVGKGRLLGERILWISALIFGMVGTALVINDSWRKYQDHPTTLTIERNRNDWIFSVPALVMCMETRVDRRLIKKFIKRELNSLPPNEQAQYKEYVTDVANLSLFNMKGFLKYKDLSIFPNVSLLELQAKVTDIPKVSVFNPYTMASLMKRPFRSEFGWCFTTNYFLSDHQSSTRDTQEEEDEIQTFDMSYKPLFYYISYPYSNLEAFLNSPFEFPQSTHNHINYKKTNTVELYVLDLVLVAGVSTPAVRELSLSQRKCLFRDEMEFDVSPIYTPVACQMQCKFQPMMDKCGCAPHIFQYFGQYNVCDSSGLVCLAEKLSSSEFSEDSSCDCQQLCDQENFHTHVGYKGIGYSNRQGIVYIMGVFPIVRYKRDIMFGKLDVLVSLGSTAGLFIGCSILSVIELLWFFTLQAAFLFGRKYFRRDKMNGSSKYRHFEINLTPSQDNDVCIRRIRAAAKVIFVKKNPLQCQTRQLDSDNCEDVSKQHITVNKASLKMKRETSKNTTRLYLATLTSSLKEYAHHSTVHGLSYIANPSQPWFLRVVWIIIWCALAGCATFVAWTLGHSYYFSSVAYEIETNFLSWNTIIPAFTHCFNNPGNRSIRDLIRNCKINGVLYDCEALFEKGYYDIRNCYSIYSHQGRKTFSVTLNDTQDVIVSASFLWTGESSTLFLHGHYEVPLQDGFFHESIFMRSAFDKFEASFIVIDEVADEDVRSVPLGSRGCRFPDENHGMWAFKYYSHTACLTQCRVQRKMELCNCTDSIVGDGGGNQVICDEDGEKCLREDNRDLLKPVNPIIRKGQGLTCDCPLSCLEQSLEHIRVMSSGVTSIGRYCEQFLRVSLGKSRRRLKVVRSLVDIAVSTGGVFGLFLGASLMSVVELLYFLLVRPIFLLLKVENEEEKINSANIV